MNYDISKYVQMDNFLKRLYRIGIQNDMSFDSDTIYNELCRYGLKENDVYNHDGKDISNYFDNWINRFKYDNSMNVFVSEDWNHFCQFNSKKDLCEEEYIKLYIPIDYDHLERGVEELFEYINRENIVHSSKVARLVRSDNVVIRLHKNDQHSAMKIINFINQNVYIKEGLNSTNPFIPTINGIGYMIEPGISYNTEISDLFSVYINDAIANKKETSLYDFSNWFKINCAKYKSQNICKEISKIFSILLGKVKKEDNNNYHDVTKHDDVSKKNVMLINAIKATYSKFGYAQVVTAIIRAIKENNFRYFSNGGKEKNGYRDRLENNVFGSEIEKIINKVLLASGIDVTNNALVDIPKYVDLVLANEIVFDLDKICSVTIDNHNSQHLYYALMDYINNGSLSRFSRFSKNGELVNYRSEIKKINREQIVDYIEKSLQLKGISTKNMETRQLLDIYSRVLSNNMSLEENGVSKVS